MEIEPPKLFDRRTFLRASALTAAGIIFRVGDNSSDGCENPSQRNELIGTVGSSQKTQVTLLVEIQLEGECLA